jgi:hypothetical protein
MGEGKVSHSSSEARGMLVFPLLERAEEGCRWTLERSKRE